jgi:hypothetical protein
MDALIGYIVRVVLLVLIAWGFFSIMGVSLPFWSLVGLSALAGEFIHLAAGKHGGDN